MKGLVFTLLLIAVAGTAEAEKDGCAGTLNGYDEITGIHITNLLLGHGIESDIVGSIFYGIMVPRDKEKQAKQILRNDAPKRGYVVWFGKRSHVGSEFDLKERLSGVDIKDVLKRAEYSSKTDIGRFLRSKEVSKYTTKCPFVRSLKVTERPYLVTPKTLSTGYIIVLLISDKRINAEKEFRGDYVLRENGRNINRMGGYEAPAPVSDE